jgi:hypothetical protein
MENIFKPGTVAHYVILATQEAEIRRSMVWSQHGQIVHETLFQKNPSQKGLVEWLCANPSTIKKIYI